jgi:hypothetical protein
MRELAPAIQLTATPTCLTLSPDVHASLLVSVTNKQTVVDRLDLQLSGIDPTWYRISIPELDLMPDATGQTEVVLCLPDGANPPAGEYPLELSARSRSKPAVTTSMTIALQIAPGGDTRLELLPRRLESHGSARFRVRLSNSSNQARVIDLSARDPQHALKLVLQRTRVTLEPGATEEVTLDARAVRRPLVAPPRTIHFSVQTTEVQNGTADDEAPSLEADGILVQRAWLGFMVGSRSRLRKLALALGALAAALLLLALYLGGLPLPEPPKGSGIATSQPTPVLAQAAPTATPTSAPAATAPPTPPPATPTEPPTPTATPLALPVISRFELVQVADGQRGAFGLEWNVSGADQVLLDGQLEPPNGSESPVEVEDDREIHLQATNSAGSVDKAIGVIVLRRPEVEDLTASQTLISAGEPATLTWKIRRAQYAQIADEQVDPSEGSVEVRPEQSTIYTLVAENELGLTSVQVEVDVRGSPPPESGLTAADSIGPSQ